MTRRNMSRGVNDAIDKAIEDIDTLISCNLTEPELHEILKSYTTKDDLQALAMVNGAIKRLMFTKFNHSLERVFFDPVYWQFFTKARRAHIVSQLRDYVEELP